MKKVTKLVCRKDSSGRYVEVFVVDRKGKEDSFCSDLDNSFYPYIRQTKPGHCVEYEFDSSGVLMCFANATIGIDEARPLLEMILSVHY